MGNFYRDVKVDAQGTRGPLPALRLEVQSHRAPPLRACDACMSRRDCPNLGDRSVLHVQDGKCAAGFKKTMKIVFDQFLPKWNYGAVPDPSDIGKLFRACSLARIAPMAMRGRTESCPAAGAPGVDLGPARYDGACSSRGWGEPRRKRETARRCANRPRFP
jgi:hypothetical protein